jgi:oligopeptide/dipeptide ABC transporter ATP-binding protein
MKEALLDIRNLSTTFKTERGAVKAVEGVSFQVRQGELLAVVGESGCGKSVTMQSVMRLYDEKRLAAYGGEVRFKGSDLLRLPRKEMGKIRGKEIAMIFQDALSSLDPVFTVEDQITESLRYHQKLDKKTARERAAELLDLVGIGESRRRLAQYPFELSGGMRQRVVIAIALACTPGLLIADEPASALDVTIQAQIMELILDLNSKLGMGVILITHDLAVVAETCSRVVVMYLGQVVEEAAVKPLFDHPAHPYTLGLLKSIPPLAGPRPKRLYAIEGSVPPLNRIPPGCRFAPRCPQAESRCFKEMPELLPAGKNQKARCWRYDPEGENAHP